MINHKPKKEIADILNNVMYFLDVQLSHESFRVRLEMVANDHLELS